MTRAVDVVVNGSGVARLSTAPGLPATRDVLLLSRGRRQHARAGVAGQVKNVELLAGQSLPDAGKRSLVEDPEMHAGAPPGRLERVVQTPLFVL